jgi:hypothetical protein
MGQDTDIISAIEAEVVQRLKEFLPELTVESMPNDAAAYERAFRVGAVLVQYSGSEYRSEFVLANVFQERVARFGVLLMIRDLRGQKGAYVHLDTVRQALVGLLPAGNLSPMYLIDDQYTDRAENVWVFTLTFGIQIDIPAI